MFEWLERAWATHDPGVIELLKDSSLLAYKDDPRFIAFPQKIGVMPKSEVGESICLRTTLLR